MKNHIEGPLIGARKHIKELNRCVEVEQRKLKRLSDAKFMNWDKASLACPQVGSFTEDEDFAVLDVAMRNERWRRRGKHNGIFGWQRRTTPADREIWLDYYEKAMEIDSNRPQKDSTN